MFLTEFVEKIRTHISLSIFFFSESRAIDEVMWKMIVELHRRQMTAQYDVQEWQFACRLAMAGTHTKYLLLRSLLVPPDFLKCLQQHIPKPRNCATTLTGQKDLFSQIVRLKTSSSNEHSYMSMCQYVIAAFV